MRKDLLLAMVVAAIVATACQPNTAPQQIPAPPTETMPAVAPPAPTASTSPPSPVSTPTSEAPIISATPIVVSSPVPTENSTSPLSVPSGWTTFQYYDPAIEVGAPCASPYNSHLTGTTVVFLCALAEDGAWRWKLFEVWDDPTIQADAPCNAPGSIYSRNLTGTKTVFTCLLTQDGTWRWTESDL